ncbi:hypothetical protein RHMOL_Rhmol02G0192400 [Rhododendron molle]|uniref:Uncharacterized protein n=1 Tax=Rhododendron molle TaxID=49168 RepID=A0ACC0PUM4_RHOML|nr:hypothetical protein RHMOL_Rhmol02G0192400 [Rhododendron molle]
MIGYVPGQADYPEDMLLRDWASHISSGWTTAGRFDWGAAALCMLYCFLGAASRGVGNTIGGYWRVVEVHWDRGAKLEAEFLARSQEVTQSRVLLECPLGWQWYLGDRVTRQSLGLPVFVVPGLLPPRVQRTESYTSAELELFTVPDTDFERHLQRTLNYVAYADRYLAISLGVEVEFERRVAGVGTQRDVSRATSRGGRSTRGRGRGTRPPVGGRGASPSGARASETAETSVPPVLPVLKWSIGVTGPSGARKVIDVPCLLQPPMWFPSQVPREWTEQAMMLMVGMRHLLKGCTKGWALQTRPAPESASPIVPQVQPRRSARTHSQDTTSLPVSAGTRGRGTQSVPRPVVEARQFEVVLRATSQRRLVLEESEESEEGIGEETEESSKSRVFRDFRVEYCFRLCQ